MRLRTTFGKQFRRCDRKNTWVWLSRVHFCLRSCLNSALLTVNLTTWYYWTFNKFYLYRYLTPVAFTALKADHNQLFWKVTFFILPFGVISYHFLFDIWRYTWSHFFIWPFGGTKRYTWPSCLNIFGDSLLSEWLKKNFFKQIYFENS